MIRKGLLLGAALAGALSIAACGNKNTADNNAPLAFVPEDTPYVFANVEPYPESSVQRWREQMQQVWPLLNELFADSAGKLEADAPQLSRLFKAVLAEVHDRTTEAQWREIGIKTNARGALYGVGALPVLRLELSDGEAFKAAFERVEKAAGVTIGTTQLSQQQVRTIELGEDAIVLIAIVQQQLVVAVVPGDANDLVKHLVLGLDRPTRSLADAGALESFNKARGYLPYGSGWLDTRRLLALIDMPKGGATVSPEDAQCNAEREAIAAKLPRFTMGYTRLDDNHMATHARIELAPALAKALVELGATIPGSANPDALVDFGFAIPVLKARDFLATQVDAVAKAPFKCEDLHELNTAFTKLKGSLTGTLPPPLADLTGVRLVLNQLTVPAELKAQLPSDFSGSLLVGSNNPAFLVGLAQMSAPPLQSLRINPDGKPVALPAEMLGAAGAGLDAQVAMGKHALGVAVGKDATAGLSAAVLQAPAQAGTVVEMNASGRLYSLMGDLFGSPAMMALLPAEEQATLQTQRKLYALYAQWFKRIHMHITFVPEGIDISQDVELGPRTGTASIAP